MWDFKCDSLTLITGPIHLPSLLAQNATASAEHTSAVKRAKGRAGIISAAPHCLRRVSVHRSRVTSEQRGVEVRARAGGWASP
jgi:hypothetical protein